MGALGFVYRLVQYHLGLAPKELRETFQETEKRRQEELKTFLEEAKATGRVGVSFTVKYLPAEKNIVHDIYYRAAHIYLSFEERRLLIELSDVIAFPDNEPKRLERLVSEEEAKISQLAEENGLKLYVNK